ncbi:PREDICTED: uncharacterized protein LOC105557609 [Vollenhovia emeryi]|uniref:uncharacterized protein LOC105557609 n=1 Tax=Vollenhovia emeryi TaxID=411798 RepID=UPI0005F3D4CE|nr:PREDICTED: uncharacterized protein LOC105557609 [Vollenhovia emeryi]
MEAVMKKHLTTKGLIDRFWDNLIKVGKEKMTQAYLKARLELLESYWRRFEGGHYNLMDYDEQEVEDYLKDDHYTATEDNYVAIKSKLTSVIKDGSAVGGKDPASATSSLLKHIQLPKISLPTFNGDQLAWESFRDLFQALVGGVPDLAPVQKLQYLKASLTHDAAAVVANIELNDKGFDLAWSELVSRYDNRRVLLASHMRAFLTAAPVIKPSPVELKRLSSSALQAQRSFESLERPVAHWDDWFVHVIVEKLDSSSRLLWEASLQTSTEFPTLGELQDFLQTRIRALEAAAPRTTVGTPTPAGRAAERKGKVNALAASASDQSKRGRNCSMCQGNHLFNYCFKFKELSVPQRREHAKKQGACLNCLKLKHTESNCPSGYRCLRCGEKHHSLLHLSDDSATSSKDTTEKKVGISATPKADTSAGTAVTSNVAALACATENQVLLSTAQLTCSNPEGGELTVRALLDSGSEASFVTERVAQSLRLARRRVQVPVSGIQGATSGVATHAVALDVGSPRDRNVRLHLPAALVLPRLTSRLPARPVTRVGWPHLAGLALADPDYGNPATVDVILGAEAYGCLLREGLRRGPDGTPSAQHTALGWVLLGSAPTETTSLNRRVTALHATSSWSQLDEALQRFWHLEELPVDSAATPEDLQCESQFAATHSRDAHGRYTVRLPKRADDGIRLGCNRQEALMLLTSLERRLMRNPTLRELYVAFMTEYLQLGHMSAVPTAKIRQPDAYYLPHHAVFKKEDPSRKIRVVFNASYRTATGYSLNNLLLAGKKLQSELWVTLSRWRLFKYVFTTDIVKMFRQILVHQDDTDLQRILWRSDPSKEVQDYRLQTVVYGTASAPYLALRTLLQLAEDEGPRFPRGASAIRTHSYVDDILLAGGHTREEALETKHQTQAILAAGGFELSKWAANIPELCPGESNEKVFYDREGVSTLGVLWSPRDDCFSLRVAVVGSADAPTKRTVLSDVARFFDPLGWAAPVLIFGKIFIQDLWMAGLAWDDPLPEQLRTVWSGYAAALPQLESQRIPRFVDYPGPGNTAELHGFSDAANRAYAATVYLRCMSSTGVVSVNLLIARVAPVKTVSIPRLELCGAVLLARLLRTTARALELENARIYAWTDSTVTLAWLRSHSARWKPFVAHRVAEVQDLVPPAQWRYVPSRDNPADAATRGIPPAELASLDNWWTGPPWLTSADYSTAEPGPTGDDAAEEELRPRATLVARPEDGNDIMRRYSVMMRLLRVSAFCLRFAHNARSAEKRSGYVSAEELGVARKRWVRIAQEEDFPQETTCLREKRPLPAKSPLLPLRPFLDPEGLLRVGGRLQQALLPFDEKHPYVLSKRSHLALLLVREAHANSLHGGPQLTRSLLLRRYWILQAGSLVRSVVHDCVRCTRYRGVNAEQQMGHLPPERTRPSRPFWSSGVDYAGPLPLRTWKGRGHKSVKGYVCLFVCLSTKAVHLEAVSDLSSGSFLAAFRRFISRRGRCQRLISDNGTNFRGAAGELRAMFRAASTFYTECAASLANDGTEWAFIPPGAPHFGGLWEAGVKSVKYHLRRVIGDACLTFEELTTLLAQIEACLNSRPLYAISSSPSDLAALTPGHLLIGESLTAVPEPRAPEPASNRVTTRWSLTTAMRDHFWRRWSSEYIHHLQQLNRWRRPAPNLAVNDLVLLKTELQPPTKWALARITALYPGPDGLVRVASVRTSATVLKRPITKLVPLPVPRDADRPQ